MRITVLTAILVFTVGARFLVMPVAAQSLATVAKQEEERRKTIKQPAKTLTNKDLGSVPAASTPPATTAGAPNAEAKSTAKSATKAKDSDEDASDATPAKGAEPVVKDQAYWSSHLQALQVQLTRDQTYVDALQTRSNALNADFVNRDDPAQRAIIAADRQKTLAELSRLNTQITADKKAIADFLEDARRAGVPPGWLR